MHQHLDTPLGTLTVTAGAHGLTGVAFPGHSPRPGTGSETVAARAREQLAAYLAGVRRTFDVALDLGGTAFDQRVWALLRDIGYGETTTYGAIARALGAEPRAVGAAVGRTPTPIVVPCHRVVGADGALTGYLGGLERKRALLAFEASGGDPAVLAATYAQRQLALI